MVFICTGTSEQTHLYPSLLDYTALHHICNSLIRIETPVRGVYEISELKGSSAHKVRFSSVLHLLGFLPLTNYFTILWTQGILMDPPT